MNVYRIMIPNMQIVNVQNMHPCIVIGQVVDNQECER